MLEQKLQPPAAPDARLCVNTSRRRCSRRRTRHRRRGGARGCALALNWFTLHHRQWYVYWSGCIRGRRRRCAGLVHVKDQESATANVVLACLLSCTDYKADGDLRAAKTVAQKRVNAAAV